MTASRETEKKTTPPHEGLDGGLLPPESGREFFLHDTVESFLMALKRFPPDLLLTYRHRFIDSEPPPVETRSQFGFIDNRGCLHLLSHQGENREFQTQHAAITKRARLHEHEIDQAEGRIDTREETGDTYVVFQTYASPANEEFYIDRYLAQVRAWMRTCKKQIEKLKPAKAVLHYAQMSDSALMVDLTIGKTHFVTLLRLDLGYDIDYLQKVSFYHDCHAQNHTETDPWAVTLSQVLEQFTE